MIKPVDFKIRQAALDVEHSFIVKAPAGSGKTTLLIKRYLRLLTTVNNPEEIIAITFTRKAASEMAAKVLHALGCDDENQSKADLELIQLAKAAREHSDSQDWDLIKNPSRLRIQTIDSLSQHLVRQMPWSAGFGAAPTSVADDMTQLYQQAARQSLLSALSGERQSLHAQRLFLAVDNDFSRVCSLLVSMLEKRDQWQRLLLNDLSATDLRHTLEANWKRSAEHILELCAQQLSAQIKTELLICARYAAENIYKSDPESPICRLKDIEEFPDSTISNLEIWRGFTSLLMTKKGSRFKLRSSSPQGVTKSIGFPTEKDGGDLSIKKQFQTLLKEFDELSLDEHFSIIQGLPDSAFSDVQWELLESLIEVLTYAVAELTVVFQQRGVCDHIEIAQRSNAALGEDTNPTDLSLRLDYQIKHLLIDEFQDTSHSQMELFHRLTAGWHADEGRTVFLVGDPMQSIYRFREADVGIYLGVFNHGLGNLPIKSLELTENFRSAKHLIEWVNQSFTAIFPSHDDQQSGAVKFVPSTAHHQHIENEDTVNFYRIEKDSEAKRVRNLLKDLLNQSGTMKDIAVLARSRTHLNEIIELLKQGDISYQGVKLDKLITRSCIQDILALTLALTHLGDKLSWLSVLRAPWCGLGLDDLTHIAQAGVDKTIWQVMQNPPDSISESGIYRIDRLRNILSPALTQVGRMPLQLVVMETWGSIGGPDTVSENDLLNIEAYLQQLAKLQCAGQIKDLSQLHRSMDDLWAVTGAGESIIKLMTMHNAKGLEFDVVILPGLYKKPRPDDSKLLIWNQYLLQRSKSSLLVSPIKTAEQDNRRYDFIKNIDTKAQFEESKRLLYVACTRARHQLHLFVSDKPAAGSLQAVMHSVVENQLAEKESVEVQAGGNENNVFYQRLPLDYKNFSTSSELTLALQNTVGGIVEYQWVGVSAKHIGTILHEVIYAIAQKNSALVNNDQHWKNKLLSMGVEQDHLSIALSQIKCVTKNMLQEARGEWILSTDHRQQKNEWALTAQLDGRLENIIIDRTFIDVDDVRWIIDYKTSVHEGGNIDGFLDSEVERYREQLDKYAAVMRLNETNSINLGLYFPLLDQWRQWTYAD